MVGIKIAMLAGLMMGAAGAAQAVPVTIELHSVQDRGGPLYVQIQTEDQFMTQQALAEDMVQDPEAGTITFDFDLPPGRYALSVWHDDNQNNTFDFNEYGTPADGWAMINGVTLRAAPTFAVNSFEVTASGGNVEEYMVYGR